MDSIPRLTTARLQLRAIFPQDAEALLQLFGDPQVARFYEFDPWETREQAETMIQRFTQWFQHGQAIRWGIFPAGEESLIGSCCFDTLHPKFRSANLGFCLRSDQWGQGLATEAVAAILNHGFAGTGFQPLHRVQAITHPDNSGASGLLERLGFQFEGTLRDYGYWKGQHHDMRCYSLLRPDWLHHSSSNVEQTSQP